LILAGDSTSPVVPPTDATASLKPVLKAVAGVEEAGTSSGNSGAHLAGCDVVFRFQSTAGTVVFAESKSKIRGGWYAQLRDRYGNGPGTGGLFVLRPPGIFGPTPYTDSPRESLYYWRGETRQGCDKWRRYRLQIEGKEAWNGNTRFVGVERVLYYPSKDGWTRSTNIDLGYIDLCLSDGNRCDEPYYPGGNSTPYPSGKD
jgi:hypothetical protein